MKNMSFQKAKLREILKQKRSEAGLTQTELAELLYKPQSYVSKYESGERSLDFVEVVCICGVIGFEVCEIIDQIRDAK